MTHQERDLNAVSHAKEYLNAEAMILEDLTGMLEADSFVALGYPSLFVYCLERLKLSPAQACYYQKVARKSLEVPELKEAIQEGQISLSEGRRLVPVITRENKDTWIKKASESSQKELEEAVSNANPNRYIQEKIKPVCQGRKEMKVGISVELEEKLSRIKDLLSRKLKHSVTLEEALIAMADGFLAKNDPLEKKERPSSRKVKSPRPGRHAVSQRLKNQIHKRDLSQCTELLPNGKRCGERRFLHIHHLSRVADGGLNTLDNLILRCSGHHKSNHLGRLEGPPNTL